MNIYTSTERGITLVQYAKQWNDLIQEGGWTLTRIDWIHNTVTMTRNGFINEFWEVEEC
jgi:hypothetical protein